MTGRSQLIFTCEHGGRQIPDEVAAAFERPLARQHLVSHRGWDPGALEAAQYFSANLHSPLIHSTVSRLVVDLNRSLTNPEVFSMFTESLPQQTRDSIVKEHYHRYRDLVTSHLQAIIRRGRTAVHVSVHTFTPVFRGQRRKIDIGLLFDPQRTRERDLCRAWKSQLNRHASSLRVAMNQPYLGSDDGLTTALRTMFCGADYLGIEIEINNQFVRRSELGRTRLFEMVTTSIDRVMAEI